MRCRVVTRLTGFAEGKSGAPGDGGGAGRPWVFAMAGLRHISGYVRQVSDRS
ncbi:hypothetical protein SAMN05661093_10356 [Kibdelosporangium aridum]|uniref:Uncharacterized protein n=1 Tax=Kibdelosporangium aridum TaxID=2030 RepID=A0A1Y5YAS3_KIBAR|nr:hypothetical protein SAMN05661093_10356 [Kibdelosporangium aridum]